MYDRYPLKTTIFSRVVPATPGYTASLTRGLLTEDLHYPVKTVSPRHLQPKIQELLAA